jgi:hypothetical protein
MEKYFEEKFGNLREDIAELKQEVVELKRATKLNGDTIEDCKIILSKDSNKIKHLFVISGLLFIILILGTIAGLEFITQGILGFLK